jgi:hypothetical protein
VEKLLLLVLPYADAGMGMKPMKRRLMIIICLCVILLPMNADPWTGGFDTRISGFSVPGVSQRDMLGIRATWMPYSSETVRPNVSAGMLTTNPFLSSGEFNLDASVSLSVLFSRKHPLRFHMARNSFWFVQVETGYFAPIEDVKGGIVYAAIAPFTLFFGDKMISAGSPMLLWNIKENSFGWGMTIVKITHFYW